MSEIRVSVSHLRGVTDRQGVVGEASRIARVEVTDMCRKIMNQATINCPVDTGFMRGQHTMGVSSGLNRSTGYVANRARYAEAVHDGTPAHIIRPRRKRVLRFVVDGRVVFARQVRHPGTTGRPWLATAARQVAGANGWTFTAGTM